MTFKNIKMAIVHDWLTNFGGAERVIKVFSDMFPLAPIYTTVYNEENMSEHFPRERVITSYINKLPYSNKLYTKMLSLMPRAFERFDLSDYDIVLSSSSSCAKGVITDPDTMHISYIHTPMRYAWDLYHEYYNDSGIVSKMFMNIIIPRIRQWDVLNTFRIDYLISNSKYVKRRIKKYYKREAKVIYPPVGTNYFTPANASQDYYLIVSRFVSYKKIDLAIKAFNKLEKKLIVVGSGTEEKYLKSLAKSNIIFAGRVSDEELLNYFQRCKALVFPGKEDFGIIPVEAQACGRPVIAFAAGGTLETVEHLKTGYLFKEQTINCLVSAVKEFEQYEYDAYYIRKHSEKFSKEKFKNEISNYISDKYKEFKRKA